MVGSAKRPDGNSPRSWNAPQSEGEIAPEAAQKIRTGTRLVREWNGRTHTVTVQEEGFTYAGRSYRSLTAIAREITGAHWSGPRFFGLARRPIASASRHRPPEWAWKGAFRMPSRSADSTGRSRQKVRCAIYTRKSTEEGLEQDFNSLDAQREACEAFILSQKHEGWVALPALYDDGGYSGGTMQRPALQRLLADIAAGGGGYHRRLQGRPAHPRAVGLRQDRRGLRRTLACPSSR